MTPDVYFSIGVAVVVALAAVGWVIYGIFMVWYHAWADDLDDLRGWRFASAMTGGIAAMIILVGAFIIVIMGIGWAAAAVMGL